MNNFVTNIIVADDEATALAVSFPGALAIQCEPSDLVIQGWYYDGNTLMETKPVLPGSRDVVTPNA